MDQRQWDELRKVGATKVEVRQIGETIETRVRPDQVDLAILRVGIDDRRTVELRNQRIRTAIRETLIRG